MRRIVVGCWVLMACTGNTSVAGDDKSSVVQTKAQVEMLAQWQGGSVSADELAQELGNQLIASEVEYLMERHQMQSQALEMMVMERLLKAEVERRSLGSIDELMALEVEAKTALPGEAEAAMLVPMVRAQLQEVSEEEALAIATEELRRQGFAARYAAFIKELQEQYKLERNLPYPDLPRIDVKVDPKEPIQGDPSAPITIVQFAEYQCYYCAQVAPTMERLLQEYKGKVRMVFKDFPLPGHDRAQPAAIAAHCAGDQGKYWEMNEALLSNQRALADRDILSNARAIGLDEEIFQACLSAGTHSARIERSMRQGESAGVQATPTFFVNGVMVPGALPYEEFAAMVERELSL